METKEQQQLRILTRGPSSNDDWEETRYLKEKGFVDAEFLLSNMTSSYGQILNVVYQRTTATGRDYADELRARARLNESNPVSDHQTQHSTDTTK